MIPSAGRRSFALLGGLVLAMTATVVHGASENKAPRAQESREQLKDVQRELGRERDRFKEARQREAALAKELAGLEQSLKQKTQSLQALETKLRDSTRRIAGLSQEITANERRLTQSRSLLKRRLRAIYKQGRFGYVRTLLGAEDFSAAARRLKYLSAVAEQDQRVMQTYRTTLSDLSRKRTELERYQAEVADAKDKLSTTRGQIAEEQRKRRVLLASVQEEKAGHLTKIKELEISAKDLQALIARLQSEEERQRRSSRSSTRPESPRAEGSGEKEESLDLRGASFERLKGKLIWPAAGPLSSGFGRQEHPRFHTVTFNHGIEIAAPEGKDIVAVAEGSAIYADWFKGYGRLIILDHGGGYFTLYAHASELLVRSGESVSRGQVIGKVGETGSLEGPQLYFEVRYKGKPQDPLAWLQPRTP